MFAGFRSRWMMPCSCAASSASAICLAIGSASSSGIAPRAMRSASVLALDQFHDERADAVRFFEAVDGGDVRMVQRGEHPGFALKPREPLRVGGEGLGQDLDRDVAIELRVARAIDLAHAAGAERRQDLVRAEAGAGG